MNFSLRRRHPVAHYLPGFIVLTVLVPLCTCMNLMASPTATTLTATSVDTNSATLNAAVNSNGVKTDAFFQYGLTTSYGSVTTSKLTGGSGSVNISNTVSSLSPGTLYHFCAVAYNSTGTNVGADFAFTTMFMAASAPTITTLAATNPGTNSATLNATVIPNGLQTTLYFQYGLTTNYGSVTASNALPAGSTPVNMSNSVGSLAAATLYHFRAVAYNTAGANAGADLAFSTMAMPSNAPTATNISAGGYHSMFLKSDGTYWGMGNNADGELGDGGYDTPGRPKEIVTNGVVAVSGGTLHSLLIKTNGSLWAMGENYSGELGDGTYGAGDFVFTPEQIVASGVTLISAGGSHSLFVKSDGSLWAMGYNGQGQLGDGTTTDAHLAEENIASGVTAIVASGFEHSLFLKSNGSLWAMGYNAFGQLGDGTTNNVSVPEQIVSSGVVAIAAGYNHSLFLKSDDSLWAMGQNYSGQLGDGSNSNTNRPEQIVSSGVIAIAGGGSHTMFIKSDGSLWAMGQNSQGELGDGTYNNTNKPEKIVASGVTAVSCGEEHGIFIKSDGSLWAVGWNNDHQLGDGFTGDSPLPEQILPVQLPVLTNSISSATNLEFVTTTKFGGPFYLLASKDLTQPFSLWTAIRTNSVNGRTNNNYNVTITNALNSNNGQQFYILQSQ